jgi:hypothetical protein
VKTARFPGAFCVGEMRRAGTQHSRNKNAADGVLSDPYKCDPGRDLYVRA